MRGANGASAPPLPGSLGENGQSTGVRDGDGYGDGDGDGDGYGYGYGTVSRNIRRRRI